MDKPFIYDNYVTGKNFVGRKMESTILANLLEAGEQVALYEPPKSGKMSLIQQTLLTMRAAGRQFSVSWVSLFNVRTVYDFLKRFGTAVIKPLYSTPDEYAGVVARHLSGTHFLFDPARYDSHGEIVCLNWEPDANDVYQMMSLPFRIAEERGIPCYVVIEEFQNLMMAKDYDFEMVFREMEKVFAERQKTASYILTGSQVNAMKLIFEERKFFYRLVEHLPLQNIDDKDIIDYISRGFTPTGKVVDRTLMIGACKLFRSNMWYLNHFVSICDSMSRGYINEGILVDALKTVISIHEPRFLAIVNDLTDHQLSLVRAILDGVVKFSASEVIDKYGLNSSANVRRVKDALKKKEVITFNDKDEPLILDPLFEYWVTKYYFEIQ